MERKKLLVLMLGILIFFSGCNIKITPVIPEEHGTIVDWLKKDEKTPDQEIVDETKEEEKKETDEKPDDKEAKEEEDPDTEAEKENTESEEEKKPDQEIGDETKDQEGKKTEEPTPDQEEKKDKEEDEKTEILKVRVTPEKPDKDDYITLDVQGPANTPYNAVFYFRTRESLIKGYCGSPFQILLGGATKGFEVKVEVTALINGQVQKATTSFIPQ